MSTLVPFSVFSERHRLREEAEKKSCDQLSVAVPDLVAAKNLIRAMIFSAATAIPESQLREASRLCGTPLPGGPEVAS